jgi:oligoendopeptidase F
MDRPTVPVRDDIDPAHRWRLEDMFASTEEWESECARIEGLSEDVAATAGTFSEGPPALERGLRRNAELGSALDPVFVYAHLLRDQDTRDPSAQAMAERASRLSTRAAETTAFLEPEILAISRESLETHLEADELSPWRHYLSNLLRMKEHTLSPREEEILAMAGEIAGVPRLAYGMLNDADLRFRAIRDEEGREVELTKGRYSAFLESPVRRVRADAWDSLTDGYERHRNTVATLLTGAVKRDLFYARARGYASTLEAALYPSNIPEEVFHSLIDTLDRRRDAIHRYTAMRKRILGLSELKVYDLYVPLGTADPPRFRYEEAVSLLLRGMAPLGEDYVSVLERGLSDGWVDVYETRGKRSGAYSWSAPGHHPYVLMNYQGTLDQLFTLAHEMGHALHSHYTNESQPYQYCHYPVFLAEVASTTNEAILMDHLLAVTEDPARRIALLNQFIDQIRGTVITQIMFAEFEHRIHRMAEEGKGLTAESVSEVYGEIYRRALGPDLSFDERAALGWARIPHFYSGYYVYQYATGYAAAITLSRRILAGGARERDDYREFLSAGDSDYPIRILRRAGVDVTTAEPIEDTMDLFESLLDQLEEHVEKYGTVPAARG